MKKLIVNVRFDIGQVVESVLDKENKYIVIGYKLIGTDIIYICRDEQVMEFDLFEIEIKESVTV